MELFRALAHLAETPGPAHAAIARALDLGEGPQPFEHTACFAFRFHPYASVHLGAEGMMGGEARDRIAGFWRALGAVPPPEPDHVAVMLSLYAELAEREATAADDRARAIARRARAAFLWEHLLSWLPPWLAAIEGEPSTPPFYARWARLLTAALDGEARAVEAASSSLPLHLRAAPPLPDTHGDRRSILAALLAPVRTGVILTRDDLVRAAEATGLGVRAGERRFVLEALLSQDAATSLRALSRIARARSERNRSISPAAIATFWSERAAATATWLDQLASVAEESARVAEDVVERDLRVEALDGHP